MSSSGDGVGHAAVLGVPTGARTFVAPATLALRGRLGGGRFGRVARFALPALAVGEMVGDKLPSAPPRVEGPGLVGRVLSGAFSGRVVGGASGASVGAAVALASTYPSQALRAAIVEHTRLPDIACALPEDLAAIAFSLAVTDVDGPKSADIERFSAHQPGRALVAGLVGVGAMCSARAWISALAGERLGPRVKVTIAAGVGLVAGAVVYEAFDQARASPAAVDATTGGTWMPHHF